MASIPKTPSGSARGSAPPICSVPNILLVEKDLVNARIMQLQLKRLPVKCRVVHVNDGQAALDALDREHFSILLLGASVPYSKPPVHLALELRGRMNGSAPQILSVSALDKTLLLDGAPPSALLNPFDGYLQIPYDLVDFLNLVQAHLPKTSSESSPA